MRKKRFERKKPLHKIKSSFLHPVLKMDVQYLKNNVNEALNEALTSMAACTPDDNIEYLGRYLIQYVNRLKAKNLEKVSTTEAENLALKYEADQAVLNNVVQEVEDAKKSKQRKLDTFCENLAATVTTKSDAMDQTTKFLANFLEVPSTYIAINKVAAESETLLYFSTNPDNTTILGQKLPKAAGGEEEEGGPTRQGVSFEAFKIPEVPEEEPAEDGEEAPPKPAPTAQPLVIDNVMRDQRCKFFGIPKLGSFAAIPLTYGSSDHENGIMPGPTAEELAAQAAAEAPPVEEGEEAPAPAPLPDAPKYIQSKIPLSMILAMDTIGKYRSFTSNDIEVASQVGNALVKALESLEVKDFERHCEYMEGPKIEESFATDVNAKITESETTKLGEVATETAELPDAADKEALIAKKNANASFAAIDEQVKSGPFLDACQGIETYILPPPSPVLFFFHLMSCMLNYSAADSKDVCGDISWTSIQKNIFKTYVSKIADYDVTAESTEMNDEAIKSFIETNALSAETLTTFPILPILLNWVTKAVASRDADKAYAVAAEEAAAAAAAAAAEAEAEGGEE